MATSPVRTTMRRLLVTVWSGYRSHNSTYFLTSLIQCPTSETLPKLCVGRRQTYVTKVPQVRLVRDALISMRGHVRIDDYSSSFGQDLLDGKKRYCGRRLVIPW